LNKNYLETLSEYNKHKRWKDAVHLCKPYKNQIQSEDYYMLYSNALINLGHLIEAEKVLSDSKDYYPDSEKIRNKLLIMYDTAGSWKKAEDVAVELIQINPNNANYYFKLGRVYSYLNEINKAESIFKQGLEIQHHLSIDEILDNIKRAITSNTNEFHSEYRFIGGKTNLGAFVHTDKNNHKYVTKITEVNKGSEREALFYKSLCSNHQSLNTISPAYIDCQVMDKVMYLTIEWIDHLKGPIHTIDIYKKYKHISSVKPQELKEFTPQLTYFAGFKPRINSIMIYFSNIEKKEVNEELFQKIHHVMKQKKYSDHVCNVIKDLEGLILNNYLYLFIDKNKHYSLLHGSLKPDNIKRKKEDTSIKIFDWAGVKIGPRFMDVVNYLVNIEEAFTNIKTDFLYNDENNNNLTSIEKIFFLYAYILCHFVRLHFKTVDKNKNVRNFMKPALKEIEILLQEFKENELEDAIAKVDMKFSDIRNNKNELIRERNQLNREIRTLKKRFNTLQNKQNDMLLSRSWKITAPLRKLTQILTRK